MATTKEAVLAAINSKNAILVCGAGISVPVFPGVGDLSNTLSSSGAEGDSLPSLADDYIKKEGREALVQLLKREYQARSSSPAQSLATLFPWKVIITTNYDSGLFHAYGKTLQRNVEVIVTEREFINSNRASMPTIIQHHGSVLRPHDTFVISSKDYEELSNSDNELVTYIKEAVNNNPVIFLGFGLGEDYLIRSLFSERSKNPRNTGYFVTLSDIHATENAPAVATLENLLGSINVQHVRGGNANSYLRSLVNLDPIAKKKAVQLHLIEGTGLKSFQLQMYYDTKAASASDLSVVRSVEINDLPTGTFYYNIAGSQSWLNLTDDKRYIYKKSIKQLKEGAAAKITKVILQHGDAIPDLVCLGSGDGKKESLIIKEVLDQAGEQLRARANLYAILVDISPPLLAAAAEQINGFLDGDGRVVVRPICTDFDRLHEHTNLLEERRSNCLLMFGNTFGNFANTEKIIADIAQSCAPGDLLVLELSLYTEIREDYLESIENSYAIDSMKEFLLTPLILNNIDATIDDLDIRIEGRSTILTNAEKKGEFSDQIEVNGYYKPRLTTKVGTVTILEGNERKIFTSKRFRRDYLYSIMKTSHFDFESEVCEDGAPSFVIFKYLGG